MTRVEIVNIALARLGESPIQSLDEGTVPANMAKVFYDPAKRATLRDFNWNFSLTTARLAKLVGTPVDFRCAFALPVDCLKAIRLHREGVPDFSDHSGIRFVVRGGKLCTDEEAVFLEYVADVDDPARFDDRFVEIFSYKLASELAMPVKGSSELMANYMNVYSAGISQAATLSAEESRAVLSDNPYVEARVYGNR